MDCELLIRNARLMTCDPERPGAGVIERGAVAISGGAIVWAGVDGDIGGVKEASRVIDAGGRLVTPGLVDCHTHAIFAGDRAGEFGLRASGAGYLEIAAAGGGIAASLKATRLASDETLIDLLRERLRLAAAGGTTTIEVKSGYDLTVEGELRMLKCVAKVATERDMPRISPTLLVHVVPPERKADRDAYVKEICESLIPKAAAQALCTAVDIYCDEGAFTLDEARAVLGAAKRAELAVKAHIGQFADLGGAELLGALGALSGDHLERVGDAGIAAMASAGVVAVMLPGACVQLRLPVPPVEKFRAQGVAMAIATDLNPGTSYCEQLPLQLWLATTHYGMTIDEAWLGVTRHGAKALGMAHVGLLRAGAVGDVVLWKCGHEADVPYRYGAANTLVDRVFRAGLDMTAM
ncbi:MAG TPA: imidazolonepropionase [Kofleriaceae bacterium]|jgi:imidazolonepropionase